LGTQSRPQEATHLRLVLNDEDQRGRRQCSVLCLDGNAAEGRALKRDSKAERRSLA
jgi:hypothetical protein